MPHVLIIEDEFLISCHLSDVAQDAGAASVDVAVSPAQALASALARPPDLIFSDVNIVDGTGPQAVSAIRECLGPIPVIFITATPEQCAAYDPAAPVLCKPVMEAQLVAAFQNLIQATRSIT
jgi:CheY-like chemotaxis protein